MTPLCMLRFTRLTDGFSKRVENHIAAIFLRFVYYNFARIHQSLRITPTMAAGVTNHPWEIGEIVHLMDAWEAREQARRKEKSEWKYANKGPTLGF